MVAKRKLQVFISSTFSDLIEERQAAVAAILKAGHIPAGMELFTAGDKSQMKTIEKWIDESDVYMLILGGRYGSIENVTGLSYTELEYDYAVSRGKPTFAVVINEAALEAKVKAGGTLFIEKENPKALATFRNKVLKNISSFFSDEKDIKLCVHESMADYASDPNLKGWIAAGDVPDVKSLRDEIDKLREENAYLLSENNKMEAKAMARSKDSPDEFDVATFDVLRAIKLVIPKNLAGGKDAEVDLFSVSYNNRDLLVTGVTDAYNADETEQFYFWSVVPKLQAHGLAQIEKVPGARYRRASLNRKGLAFFAAAERRLLLKVSKKDSAEEAGGKSSAVKKEAKEGAKEEADKPKTKQTKNASRVSNEK